MSQLLKGIPVLDWFVRITLGTKNQRDVKRYTRIVDAVNALEPEMRRLTDAELRGKTEEFRTRIAGGQKPYDLIPEIFAVAREAMDRAVGIRNIFNPARDADLNQDGLVNTEDRFDPSRLEPDMRLDYAFKTRLFWIVSRTNNCQYCLGHQESKLLAAGMGEDQIAALDSEWTLFPAREQAAAITDKLAAIQAALQTEQIRQQDEMQRSNRTLLWVAAAFGLAGMGAMAFTAVFQWRTMNRIAELVPTRAQLMAGSSAGLLGSGEMPGKAVELSNQRLMSVIERLERRVLELEAASLASVATEVEVTPVPENGQLTGDAARITVLLGKGQSMLNADHPERALECYDAILAIDQNHPEALVKKGAALERLKQDDAALLCYDRAIQADETLTIAYLYKGGVYNRLERYNEALECYEQALRVQGKQA